MKRIFFILFLIPGFLQAQVNNIQKPYTGFNRAVKLDNIAYIDSADVGGFFLTQSIVGNPVDMLNVFPTKDPAIVWVRVVNSSVSTITTESNTYLFEDSTNTPPTVFPAIDTTYWMVGGAPTGIFVGHDFDVAVYVNGVFDVFIDPNVNDWGLTLDDNFWHQFNGSTWPRRNPPDWKTTGNFGGGILGSTNNTNVFLRFNNQNRIILQNTGTRFPQLGGVTMGVMGLNATGLSRRLTLDTLSFSFDNDTLKVIRGRVVATNGLTNVNDSTIELGGSLTKTTSIANSAFQLSLSGNRSAAGGILSVANSNTGTSATAISTTGTISATRNTTSLALGALMGTNSTGQAMYLSNASSTVPTAKIENTATGAVTPIVLSLESTNAGAVDGYGIYQNFRLYNSSTISKISNRFLSRWNSAATDLSELVLYGLNTTETALLSLLGTGAAKLNQYGSGTFTGTPTYSLQVDASGNIIEGSVGGGGGGAALTMNNSGSGAASGTTFDGSVARIISHNTIGAVPYIGATDDVELGDHVLSTDDGGDLTSFIKPEGVTVQNTNTAGSVTLTASDNLIYTTGVNIDNVTGIRMVHGNAHTGAGIRVDLEGNNAGGLRVYADSSNTNAFISLWTKSHRGVLLDSAGRFYLDRISSATPSDVLYYNSSTKEVSYGAPSGGGSSLFPMTGTGTATGDVVGELDGNGLTVTNGSDVLFGLSSGDNGGYIQNNTGTKRIAVSDDNGGVRLISDGVISINNAYTIPLTDGTAGQVLTTDGSGAATWEDGGSVSGANPSATIGLTAVNGSAGTFLRSDGAPALSQSITPTWTGTHTFSNPTAIVNAVNNTSGFNIQIGTSGFQSYDVNNFFFSDNIYYSGGFLYKTNGLGILERFNGGDWQLQTAPSGTGGTGASLTTRLRVQNGGGVIINSDTYAGYMFDVAGTMRATGVVTFSNYGAGTATFDASGVISSVSDERVKRNIKTYRTGLRELMKINPIEYKYNGLSGNETNGTYVGFSAQNVKDNIPYSTGVTADGYLTLQDRAILATLVNAVKEQQAEIEALKKEINQLKKSGGLSGVYDGEVGIWDANGNIKSVSDDKNQLKRK